MDLVNIGVIKFNIDEYYWNEIFDIIGKTYKIYSDATSAVIGTTPDFKHIDMRILRLDLDKLKRNPDLEGIIFSREAFLKNTRTGS